MMPKTWRKVALETTCLTSLLLAAVPVAGQVLPQGGGFTAGSGSIAVNGSTMTVTQQGGRGIVNWQSFSIGQGGTVAFDNGSGATLNRVTGGDPSSIMGRLSATGSLYLINPNGVVVGPSGTVTTGGSFVASTHDVTNDDFLSGRALTFKGDSTATVENLGAISSSGGDVLLIAREVSNKGSISAPKGTAALAGGHEVLLTESSDGGTGRVMVRVGPGKVDNQGTIQAAQAELKAAGGNIYALAGNNGGIVRATGSETRGGEVWLSAGDGHVQNTGTIAATNADGSGGAVTVTAGNGRMAVNTGTLSASGSRGGTVKVAARQVSNQGRIAAEGTVGAGGAIDIAYGKGYIGTSGSEVSAHGTARGGTITVASGEAGSTLFTSGLHRAGSAGGSGGSIDLFGSTINLVDAVLRTSGIAQGGSIRVGGDYQGGGSMLKAGSVLVSGTTSLLADGVGGGAAGGRIIVWSEDKTDFYGKASARGAGAGAGGLIEVSSHDTLVFAGLGDAGSDAGRAGTLLLDPKNIVISSAGGLLPQYQLIDPNGDTTSGYGTDITSLANGNVVVTNPYAVVNGDKVGAVYLFNGLTGALISMLTGSDDGDAVGGGGVTVLSNGNYVIKSPSWINGPMTSAGAATWASGSAGVAGIVSDANSLVGNSSFSKVGSSVTALTNGNYVVGSPEWTYFDGVNSPVTNVGAVTWGSGATGVVGLVSAANSLIGTKSGDRVGATVTALTNGNYVVGSPSWSNGALTSAGAVTWSSGTTGIVGAVSAANSGVGASANDKIGATVTALTNGNYVMASPSWANGSGAVTSVGIVTWGSGATGFTGVYEISAGSPVFSSFYGGMVANSRFGSSIVALSNGNYLILSPDWTNNPATAALGAVTWADGATALTAAEPTAANSLIGAAAGDRIGSAVTVLSNGNFVVSSTSWSNGAVANAGAATWGSGAAGVVGVVSAANSLVGTTADDKVGATVVALPTNGNYVVGSPTWSNGGVANAGAATWGNGSTGIVGAVSAANSLVGTTASDQVGSSGIVALSNGNYVVGSSTWSNGGVASAGAATWVDGSTGIIDAVSAANSLVGTSANDKVGARIVALPTNGNYVVGSWNWRNGAVANAGAATWGDGSTGLVGAVSAANSLVGTAANDMVGSAGIVALTNGDYVVASNNWSDGAIMAAGAATRGDGSTGITGAVSASNSLVGTVVMGGLGSSVIPLSNGGYIYGASSYASGALISNGAAAWSGAGPLIGPISPTNSFFGWAAMQVLTAVSGPTRYAAGSDGTVILAHNGFVSGDPAVEGRVYIGLPVHLLTYARAQGQTVTIHPDAVTAVLNTGTALTLQANTDITLDSDIIINNPAGNGGAFSLWAGRSILLNANIVTDNGNFTALANAKASTGVVNAHRDSGAAVITMAAGKTIDAGTGAVVITLDTGAGNTNTASGDITLDGITAGTITVENAGPGAGNIIIRSGATLTASGAGNPLVLAASSGGNFINNGTSSALSASNGRWLVYSKNPANNTLGGLTGTGQYSTTYAGTPPGSVGGSANMLLYSDADPTLSPPPPPPPPPPPSTPGGAVLTLSPFDVTITYGDGLPTFAYGASGLLGTDTLASVLSGTPLFSTTAFAGSGVGHYTIALDLSGLSVASGYTLGSTTATLTIVARVLTLAGGKVYDGTTSVSGLILSGLVDGDDVSLGGIGVLSDRNAGTGKTITGLSLTGRGASNYVLATGTAYTVAARAVTATGSKTYDGTTGIGGLILAGITDGDEVALSGTGILDSKGADSGKAVTGLSLTGRDAGNYTLSGATYTVTGKTLTWSVPDAASTFGTAGPWTVVLNGLANGDQVEAVLSAFDAFGNLVPPSALGIGSYTLRVTGLTGRDAGNYVLSASGNTAGRLTVTPSAAGGTSIAAVLNALPVVTTPMSSSGGALLGTSGGASGVGSVTGGGTGTSLGNRTAGVGTAPAGGWVGAASAAGRLASDAPVVVDAGRGMAPSVGSAVENSLSTGGFLVVFRQPAGFSGPASTGTATAEGTDGGGSLAFASSFTTFRADEAVESTVVAGGAAGTPEDGTEGGSQPGL